MASQDPSDASSLAALGVENPTVDGHFDIESTLYISDSTSFTLSPKSLIIRATDGAKKSDKKSAKPVGQSSRRSVTLDAAAYSEPMGGTNTRAIALHNILWAETTESELLIHYAKQSPKIGVEAATLKFDLEDRGHTDTWVERLLERAYGKAQRKKRVKVLINPKSGKGAAEKIYNRYVLPMFDAARLDLDVTVTKTRGEAIEIAESLDIEAYDIIVCCSGDGTPHEVFNGLGKRKDASNALTKIAIAQIPCGSGNAMHCNLSGSIGSPSIAAVSIIKGIRTPFDLISITQGETRYLSFLSQALGIVAEFDLATEHLRWMGGTARFTYGFLVRAIQKKIYPCEVAVKVVIDNKDDIKEHYRKQASKSLTSPEFVRDEVGSESGLPALKYGTVKDAVPEDWEVESMDKMSSFYCGNMSWMATDVNYFPAALPNDGCMDMVAIGGDISRVSALGLLPAVENGKFFGLPHVSYRKVSAYRITPKNQADGYISMDGERVPFEPFQAEVHRGLGTVLTKDGCLYDAPGPQ
ncbi:putative sphingosine kinase protein [Coleophoma cylindrospora]|uniref:Putative sphingosine kinase protein n=1 Tax=Coleophoma cylindrospora TaxID=1849047 RepID=A0A3D8S137_9HELO|nr:putative sphingosine kinase protein [Coleophoma cylindrospora]